MAFVSRKRVGCNGRKAVDQELARPAAAAAAMREEQRRSKRVGSRSRGGRGGGEEKQAHLQRRLVRGRLEQGRRQRRETSRGGRRGLLRGLLRGDRPAAPASFLKRPISDRTSRPCGVFLLFTSRTGAGHEDCQSTPLSIFRKENIRSVKKRSHAAG